MPHVRRTWVYALSASGAASRTFFVRPSSQLNEILEK